jgi:hypothetical protein
VFGGDRQLDALASQRQHPVVEGFADDIAGP